MIEYYDRDWGVPLHDDKVQFTVGAETFDGIGRLVDSNSETDLVKQVSSLMKTKHRWSDGLMVELRSSQ